MRVKMGLVLVCALFLVGCPDETGKRVLGDSGSSGMSGVKPKSKPFCYFDVVDAGDGLSRRVYKCY